MKIIAIILNFVLLGFALFTITSEGGVPTTFAGRVFTSILFGVPIVNLIVFFRGRKEKTLKNLKKDDKQKQ